jgi:pimeloyl-ACP methyl ester carboxylesterase
MQNLVLLPGLLCDVEVWQDQIAALSDIATCSCLDWGSLNSIAAMAELVLRTAPERFAMAGHSMGGRVAFQVYRMAPDRVTRIALLNTAVGPRPPGAAGEEEERKRYALLHVARTDGMRAMAMQWLPPMMHPDRMSDTALVESIVTMIERKSPDIFEAQIQALLGRPDASPVLGQIRCPALFLSGREDGWSPPARHADMAAAIPGSKLAIIPDSGHMSTMERPAAVSQAMRDWLM